MDNIRISAIAAMAQNHTIGNKGDIPWHISEDFKHFKKTTMNKPMIMGRKTFETLPGMLKGRTHIVISRSNYSHKEAKSATSLEDGISLAKDIAQRDEQDEIFIIGGGEIYKQSMGIIDRLYLTVVHKNYEGDAYFPDFDWKNWTITNEERHDSEDPAYTFFTLERKD